MTGRRDPQRGSLAIEAAILVPAIMLLFGLVFGLGRLQTRHGTVDEAARTAARTLSLDRTWTTQEEANAKATEAVGYVLGQEGVTCPGLHVTTTLGFIDYPAPRTLRTVQVDVTCTTKLNDLIPDWVPGGEVTVHGQFTSVIDRYRSQ